jgi:hypothetical protein
MPDYCISGTYIKVVPYGMDGDAYQVLYLLESSRFMFTGWWRGYELTVAGGAWSTLDEYVTLQGSGRTIFHDAPEINRQMRPFSRRFKSGRVSFTPDLTGDSKSEDWSLLGWKGPFIYAGRTQFYPIEHPGFPRRQGDVDDWVQKFIHDAL